MVLALPSGTRSSEESFAYLWFNAMARFHGVKEPDKWQFTEEHVIAYLRSKVKQKTPIYKRIKIIQGIIWFRNHAQEVTRCAGALAHQTCCDVSGKPDHR